MFLSCCCLSFHVSISIDFPLNSKRDALFHHIGIADWGSLHDHLRDVPSEDIFKFCASAAAASEFCGWVQAGTDVYIPHYKYHVNPDSSSWFSTACTAATFSVCINRINLLNPK